MAGSQRLKRMADSVQRELSELIRQELERSSLRWSSDHLCGEG
jgi:ribosome-binding factor A